MKGKIFLTILFLLIPQIAFAQTFFITGEGRGSFLHDTRISTGLTAEEKPIYLYYKDRPSYKVGVGMRFAENFDVGIFYTRLIEVKQRDDRSRANTIPINVIRSENYTPNTATTGFSETDLSLDTIDFEVGYTFRLKKMDLRLMGGVRFEKYSHHYLDKREHDCLDQFACSLADAIPRRKYSPLDYTRNINVDGMSIGPRIGLSASIPFKIIGNDFKFIFGLDTAWLLVMPEFYHTDERISYSPTAADPKARPVYTFVRPNYDDYRATSSMSVGANAGFQHSFNLAKGITLVATAGYHFDGRYQTGLYTSSYSHPPKRMLHFTGNPRDDILMHGPFLRTTINF